MAEKTLATECGRSREVIGRLRQLIPDFKTIADFRKDHAVAGSPPKSGSE